MDMLIICESLGNVPSVSGYLMVTVDVSYKDVGIEMELAVTHMINKNNRNSIKKPRSTKCIFSLTYILENFALIRRHLLRRSM